MQHRPLGPGQLRVFDFCLLRALFGGGQFLFFGLDFFLGFGFGLGIADLGLFSDIVEIEHLLPGFGLSAEYFPELLLLSQLLGVHFFAFHLTVIRT